MQQLVTNHTCSIFESLAQGQRFLQIRQEPPAESTRNIRISKIDLEIGLVDVIAQAIDVFVTHRFTTRSIDSSHE
jgi:hypothetical protein